MNSPLELCSPNSLTRPCPVTVYITLFCSYIVQDKFLLWLADILIPIVLSVLAAIGREVEYKIYLGTSFRFL